MEHGPLLGLTQILKAEVLPDVPEWWAQLPSVTRGRVRWVTVEPADLPMPRQRVKNEAPRPQLSPQLMTQLRAAHISGKGEGVFRELHGEHLDAWRKMVYQTTNQTMDHVRPPPDPKSDSIWLRSMVKSHPAVLKPSSQRMLEDWLLAGASNRQKEALSDLLWSLNDFLSGKRGRTEYGRQYGPKLVEKSSTLINPYYSSLGRPSSAPIAPPIQLQLEATKRMQDAQQLAKVCTIDHRAKSAGPNRQIEMRASKLPMKWPGHGTGPLMSETQSMQRSLVGTDVRRARPEQSFSACPPATCLGRHIGYPVWHGNAQYQFLKAQAITTFPKQNFPKQAIPKKCMR